MRKPTRTIGATLAIVVLIGATLAIVAVMATATASSSGSGGDGSVSPIRSGIAPSTWQAMGSHNGGEVISQD